MTNRIVKIVFRGEGITALSGQVTALGKSVAASADQMTAASKESVKFRHGLTAVGDTAGKVGLVAAGGLGLVSKAAMDWESAWAGVTKTVNGTEAELAKVETGLRDLATTLPATHGEIAAVAEAAGQLGVATEDIVSFTRTMVDLGETTNLTADEAATAIAQMANVMGTSGDDVDNLGSALVALGNDGASTEKQIIEMAQGISGAAAIVGASESDVLAIANAVASMGIEVEAGGTAVSRVLTDMAKATSQGGEELETFAETAGMTASEFAAAFQARPAEALAAFTSGLDRVRASGGDVFTVLDQLKLSDVRVSRALLGMAASGDLLTDSLQLGSKAWEENTALAAEAEKRYATTASQAQVAFNQIKDSAIEFGDVALPVIAAVADKVGDAAEAFGDLPGPVKQATTGLLAITAVTGGALWFGSKVIGGIAKTRANLADLGVTAGQTRTSLAAIGKGIQFVAIIEGINMLDGALQDLMNQNLDGSTLMRSMTAFAETGKVTGTLADTFGKDLGKFGKYAKEAASGMAEFTDDVFGWLPGDTTFDIATRQIELLDETLAGLVESGQQDQAAAIFEALSASAKDAGVSTGDLTGLFEQYGIAVDTAASATDDATGATKDNTAAASANAAAAQQSAAAQEAAAEALKESREAARETAQEFFGLGDSVDDAEVSLGGWLKSLEDQAAALRDFTANARKAAKSGLREGLIAELEAAGPAGALRMEQLANATDAEIKRANRAWKEGQKAIRAYTDQVGGVPPTVATKIDLTGDAEALAMIRKLKTEMAGIKDKTVRLTYYVNQINAANKPRVQPGNVDGTGADGATVPKTGLPYADRHLYMVADGEEIVSDRYGGATKNRGALKAASRGARLAVVGMADGGTAGSLVDTGRTRSTMVTSGAPIDYDRLAGAVVGNRLLEHRDSRDALLWAMRTALRETPILRASRDLSMLAGA